METYIDTVTELVSERTHIKNKNLVHLYALLVLVKLDKETQDKDKKYADILRSIADELSRR